MKKTLALAAAVTMLAFSLSGCASNKKEKGARTAEEPVSVTEYIDVEIPVPAKLCFLGDSIPAGFGLDFYDPDDLSKCSSYPNLLHEQYAAEISDVCVQETYNESVSGYTSTELLELIRSGEIDYAIEGADAVVISIGGNDVLGIVLEYVARSGIDFSDFSVLDVKVNELLKGLNEIGGEIDYAINDLTFNLREITQEVRARTDGDIYFQTVYEPIQYFSYLKPIVDFCDKKIKLLNEAIYDASIYNDERIYSVIDVVPPFEGKYGEYTNIKKYDIHPNDEGHKLLAEEIDSVLREKTYSVTVVQTSTQQ